MIKALIFDLDNTLYDYDAAHKEAFQALTRLVCGLAAIPADQVSVLHREAMQIQKDRAGINSAAIHNRLLRYQIMLELLGQPVFHAPRMAEAYWTAFLSRLRPYPFARESIAYAKSAGCKVGLGTNMTADYQYVKLDRLGLLEEMDFIVTSEEAGAEKPDSRLFALCVEKAGCLAEECCFVGDSLSHDAEGAKAAGLHPVWLCADPQWTEEVPGIRRIRSLKELPALLYAGF